MCLSRHYQQIMITVVFGLLARDENSRVKWLRGVVVDCGLETRKLGNLQGDGIPKAWAKAQLQQALQLYLSCLVEPN